MAKEKKQPLVAEQHDKLRRLIDAWNYLDDTTDADTVIEVRPVSSSVQKALQGNTFFINAAELAAQLVLSIQQISGDKLIYYKEAYWAIDQTTGEFGTVSPPAGVLDLESFYGRG